MGPAWLWGIGWAALAIVCLGSGLIAWFLFGRLELEGGFHLALEYRQEELGAAEAFFLAACRDAAPDTGEWLKLDGGLTGHVRALGGLLQLDPQGIRFLGYRPRRGRLDPVFSERLRQRPAVARVPRILKVVPRGQWMQLVSPARQALGRTWRALRLTLHLEGEYGLDDPAATGMLAGSLATWTGCIIDGINARAPGTVSYRFTPVFDRTVLAVRCRVRARPRPVGLVWPWLRLALHPQARRLWWTGIRRSKQGGRKHGSQGHVELADRRIPEVHHHQDPGGGPHHHRRRYPDPADQRVLRGGRR